MKYPVRNPNGEMVLEIGHFGIKDPIYLFAMRDFVAGYSIEQSATKISSLIGLKISRTMIRDNFRCNLYDAIRGFAGEPGKANFYEYCLQQGMPLDFNGKNSVQMSFCAARYLLEVFDLYEPIYINYNSGSHNIKRLNSNGK